MDISHLEATILLRVLRDNRVEEIAIEYYAHAQLHKLIGAIEQIAAPEKSRQAGDTPPHAELPDRCLPRCT
jgi:hypothetical protein